VALADGAAQQLSYEYMLTAYRRSAAAGTAVPNGSFDAVAQLTYTIQSGDPGTRYKLGPDGEPIDTFVTSVATSNLEPVTVSHGNTASPAIDTSGPTAKVLVIDYNTSGGSSDGSSSLTTELVNGLSNGAYYHQEYNSSAWYITSTYHVTGGPPLVNYNQITGGDFATIFSRYNICNLAATQGVYYVWIWVGNDSTLANRDPKNTSQNYTYYFPEWVTTGPTFSQSYGTNVPTCAGHTVTTFVLNYTRTVAEAQHSAGHSMEGVLQWAFGPTQTQQFGTDMYDKFDGQNPRYAGYNYSLNVNSAECGDVHYPPNTTTAYNYNNNTNVYSDCTSFNPGQPSNEHYVATNNATWKAWPCDSSLSGNPGDCVQQQFLTWWMQNMPGTNNTVYDCGGQAMPNWWNYIAALDTVTTTTQNQC
jgi:hypothetical protein